MKIHGYCALDARPKSGSNQKDAVEGRVNNKSYPQMCDDNETATCIRTHPVILKALIWLVENTKTLPCGNTYERIDIEDELIKALEE